MTTVLAIRHVSFEDLGLFSSVLEAAGASIRYVDAPLVDWATLRPEEADLVAVLGGPIGAYQEDDYPFLIPELKFVETRLTSGRPIIGICLGSQIMARALGAPVYKAPVTELRWAPLQLTEAGKASPLHHIDGSKTSVLHWHGDTFDLPDGATRLASTDLCLNQAFSWGEAALALQFHVETMGAALETWFVGHTAEIASHDGVSVASLRADNQHWTPILEPYARQFFEEWMTRTGL